MASVNIVISSGDIDATLTNFPLVITQRDLPSEFWDDATSSNIQCKAEGGGSDLLTEVAWCDVPNERLRVHVLVPSISSSADTTIELHWDVTQTNTGSVFTMYDLVVPMRLTSQGDLANYGSDAAGLTVQGPSSITWSDANGANFPTGDASIDVDVFSSTSDEYYMSVAAELDTQHARNMISIRDSGFTLANDRLSTGSSGGSIATELIASANPESAFDPTFAPFTAHLLRTNTAGDATASVWGDGGDKDSEAVTNDYDFDEVKIGEEFDSSNDWEGNMREARVTLDPSFITDAWVKFESLNMLYTDDYTVTTGPEPAPPRPVRSIKINQYQG